MLAPVRRLPFITTLHGTDITLVGTDRSYFPITKFSIEQSDGITSISDYLRAQTEDVFGVRNEIRVIKNFVNCEIYHPDNAKTGAAALSPKGEKLLIHLSNFRPVKRPQDCIRILAEVLKSAPAHLLMVGDGPERGPCEHLARDLRVYDHVTFMGKQDHVERLIPLAHVLLLPSQLESFGLAALEGMACGVVPVTTRVGGIPELVTDGEGRLPRSPRRCGGARAAGGATAARRNPALSHGESRALERRRAVLHGSHHSQVRALLRGRGQPRIE